jgi:opacity protein-like surface antigen
VVASGREKCRFAVARLGWLHERRCPIEGPVASTFAAVPFLPFPSPRPTLRGVAVGALCLAAGASSALDVTAPATAGPGLRADPSQDPHVTTLLGEQASALRRVPATQMAHLRGRLQDLHGGDDGCRNDELPRVPDLPETRRRWGVPLAPVETQVPVPALHMPLAACRRGGDATTWSAGSLRIGSAAGMAGGSGLRFHSDGVTIGADRRLAARLRVGLSLGLAHERGDTAGDGSANAADALVAAAYASYRPTRRLFVDAMAGYGNLQMRSSRPLARGGRGDSERAGDAWFASVAAGYRMALAGAQWAPYTRLDALGASLLPYVDAAGPDALRFQRQEVPRSNAALGIEASSSVRTAFGRFAPRGRFELRREFERVGAAAIAYVDDATAYVLDAAAMARTAMTLDLGLAWRFTGKWALDAGYSRDVASDARSTRIDVRLSWPLP